MSSSIASALDGAMLTSPCQANTDADVCSTNRSGTPCPRPNLYDPALSGVLTTNTTVTLGGSASTTYTVNLRVQGVVEAKRYLGGTDSNSTALSPAANGFYQNGQPDNGTNAYNSYMIRTSSPAKSYFLNSLVPPYISDHTTYGVDFTAQIRAQGKSTIRLVASDSNCSQIKNCGPVKGNGQTCLAPITLVPASRAVAKNPGFNFNQPYNGQWLVMTVTSVTAP